MKAVQLVVSGGTRSLVASDDVNDSDRLVFQTQVDDGNGNVRVIFRVASVEDGPDEATVAVLRRHLNIGPKRDCRELTFRDIKVMFSVSSDEAIRTLDSVFMLQRHVIGKLPRHG